MKEFAKYLLAAAAACFVGLGSGLISLYEPVMEYDRETYKLVFEVEESTGTPVRLDTDCASLNDSLAECKLAKHLLESVNAQEELFDRLFRTLLWGGFGLALIGFVLTGLSVALSSSHHQPNG